MATMSSVFAANRVQDDDIDVVDSVFEWAMGRDMEDEEFLDHLESVVLQDTQGILADVESWSLWTLCLKDPSYDFILKNRTLPSISVGQKKIAVRKVHIPDWYNWYNHDWIFAKEPPNTFLFGHKRHLWLTSHLHNLLCLV